MCFMLTGKFYQVPHWFLHVKSWIWAGDVCGSGVECVFNMCETQCSISSTTKEKKILLGFESEGPNTLQSFIPFLLKLPQKSNTIEMSRNRQAISRLKHILFSLLGACSPPLHLRLLFCTPRECFPYQGDLLVLAQTLRPSMLVLEHAMCYLCSYWPHFWNFLPHPFLTPSPFTLESSSFCFFCGAIPDDMLLAQKDFQEKGMSTSTPEGACSDSLSTMVQGKKPEHHGHAKATCWPSRDQGTQGKGVFGKLQF